MAAPITLATGEQVYVGISIGTATYHDGIESEYTLLAQADSSLYQAKQRAGTAR